MASNENRLDEGANIAPERLCEAAEAALKAVVEVSQRNGGRWIYPTDIMTGPMHPTCLKGFTLDEIEQASRFLVRLGVIDPRRAPRRAA
jgi:hypothetical protein